MGKLSKSNLPGALIRFFNRQMIFHFGCRLAGFIVLMGALIKPLSAQQSGTQKSSVVDIGTRRELFVDEFMIDKLSGKAELRLHHPELHDVAIVHDEPWEGILADIIVFL